MVKSFFSAKNYRKEDLMKSKVFKLLTSAFICCTIIFAITIPTLALQWDGSSSGGGGGGTAAGPNGYGVRTTDDNCLGYRFSVVDKSGNNKVSKVIDVFRNTYCGNLEFNSAYKFNEKYNKKQLINNQNYGFSTSKNNTNCYKETEMGFASSLTTPDRMNSWQSNYNNLNRILSVLGVGSISNLMNGDKVLVEPLYNVRLQSIFHSVTVTELAIFGKYILGASSNGGSSSTSASWGFISNYTNMHYPNSLYTPDGQGLWTGAGKLSSRATFHTIINSGYGCAIAYTETKPDFSPILSVNVCEAWPGNQGNRVSYYGTSFGSAFGNYFYGNGYPTKGDTIWYAINFPPESQNVKVRQSIRLQGGNWTSRNVYSSSGTWYDVSIPPATVDSGRNYYMVEVKADWIDESGNILKYGAVKSFYIPIKPKINRNLITMYDITGKQTATNGTAGQSGFVYVGQKVYPKYTFTSDNPWTSYSYLRGALYEWTNGSWRNNYPYNDGRDLFVDNQGINIYSKFEKYSDYGLYTVPDNSANTNGGNSIPFRLWTYWSSDITHTSESTWIDIPVVKADVALADIRLIDENGYYVTGKEIYAYQIVTPQYTYKNNTGCTVYVEGYNNDNSRISGAFAIPAYGQINVNGKPTTVTNTSAFSIWGGVYLDGAGRGNTSWETNGDNNQWIKNWEVKSPLSIEVISPNASYRDGTEVITSFKVYNSASENILPADNVTVNFTVQKGSSILYQTIKSAVVIPEKNSNLVYFKWTVPSGYGGSVLNIKGDVIQNGNIIGSDSLDNTIAVKSNSQTPDTTFEKNAPNNFSVISPPSRTNVLSNQWLEWVYENNTFIKKTYSFALDTASKPVLIPDVNSPSREYKYGLWNMKSGYGFIANWNVNFSSLPSTLYPPSSSITNAQTAFMYFPEYAYSNETNKYRALSNIGKNSFALPSNFFANNARLHYVPLWYPNGNYIAQGYIGDIWTPAGMLSGYMNSAPIIISESAYDDWYIRRKN